jgi:hypothetical protein
MSKAIVHRLDPARLAEAFRQYRLAVQLDYWERLTGKREAPDRAPEKEE